MGVTSLLALRKGFWKIIIFGPKVFILNRFLLIKTYAV